MRHLRTRWLSAATIVTVGFLAGWAMEEPAAPKEDRVGFPKRYDREFTVLRAVNRAEKGQVVTVYGNGPAAKVNGAGDLPYPNGSVIVMETADAKRGADGKVVEGGQGIFERGKVVGLHVMKRGEGFGEAYGKNRSGDWEYAEYDAGGGYITPPSKSFACAECHVKAGPERDFVYRGRLPETLGK